MRSPIRTISNAHSGKRLRRPKKQNVPCMNCFYSSLYIKLRVLRYIVKGFVDLFFLHNNLFSDDFFSHLILSFIRVLSGPRHCMSVDLDVTVKLHVG